MDRKNLLKKKFVELKRIAYNPKNPREDFQDKTLGESIEAISMIDPIDVRPVSKEDQVADGIHFVVCDGDRRLDILKKIHHVDHMLTVGKDVIIHDITLEEAFDFNVTKNMERKNYNLREECNIVQHYKEQGLSQREVKDKCNRSRGWVRDRLFILSLKPEIQADYFSGDKSIGLIRSGSQDPPEESPLAGKLVQGGVVRETIAIEGLEEKPITKPPKISCPTEFFEDLKDAFPNVQFLDVIPSGAFTAFNIETDNEGTLERINKIIENLHLEVQEKVEAKKSRPIKQEGPKENRTTYFTQEQFEVIKPQLDEHEVQSHQIIDDYVNVLWRNDQLHYNAIQWILENKDKFPLDEFQLKQYTDLKPDEIKEVVEREVSDSEPCFIDVSQKEYDSFSEEIKYLISKEEKQKGGFRRVWFRTWVDYHKTGNWLKPSQVWDPGLLDFPAKTFKNTNLQDVLVEIKDPFPVLYQELRNLQKLTKKISSISNTTIMSIFSSLRAIQKEQDKFVDQLLLIKRRRRIDNGREEHKKICDKCLQPKWMGPQQILCGNCEYQERQQKKKSAAATSSGGRA